jgi:probable selenium-dependent hydroxylase accessory protein YqeC
MPTIPELLDLRKIENSAASRPEVAAVIGSGGKTVLLWLLADSLRARKVLVSTTVRMRPPQPDQADVIVVRPGITDISPLPGVTFAAVPCENNKVASPPLPLLDRLFPLFDVSLLESDGASGRPYKGWAEYEPVMPEAVTLTIAVMPVPAPGWTVDERRVHRLPLFCAITGARAGDAFRPEHLAKAIAHPDGLLGKARGRIILFFNQVENPSGEAFARETVSLLPEACRERPARIVAGSVHGNQGVLLHQGG